MERSGNFYKAIRLGYILISILIGCMAYNSLYEWQEIEALELGNKKIDELRKEINNINIQMIKFSLLGETILEWNDKDIEHYHARRMAMDSMLCRFKATYPAERIDSVRSLLEDKERQMFQIVRLMDEQQSINKKIANQIPVIVQKSVQEQSKKPKRKGFLGIFGKKKEVTPAVSTTILHSVNRNVISEQKVQDRQLSEQADSLAARNAELNRQLQELICQIEEKVQTELQSRENEIVAMREKSFMQVGGLMGFVLLLLLISYIIIHRDAKSIKQYKYPRNKVGTMKCLINTIAVILFFTSCCANAASGNEMTTTINVDSVGSDYTANATAIEQRKQEMLVVADSVGHFWFSDDTEFQSQDPHAYWLMNRMMQMVQLVQTADDDWAWMLAMNESVEEYNSRLGRKIGSVDAAANAIDELINIYNAGNQPELNTASYVESILEHYKAVYAYYSLIEFIDDYDEDSNWDVQLRALYYREFKEWFDLNNAVNGIMYFYTYAAAGYSALSMDLNGTFEIWSKNRLAELDIEQDIYWSYDWKPFSSDAKNISAKKFEKLLSYFKTRTNDTVVEEMVSDWAEKDYDFARERTDGRFDFDKIAEMVRYYETALSNWREVREQITQMLPKEKQKSYREITKQMHTRLYNDLVDLKEIRY